MVTKSSIEAKVYDVMSKVKSSGNSIQEDMTNWIQQHPSEKYVTLKNFLFLLIVLDICRYIAVYTKEMHPNRLDQMDLNLSFFLGLDLIALYGVYKSHKPSILVHLAFNVGRIPASLLRLSWGATDDYYWTYSSSVFSILNSATLISLVVLLITYLRLRLCDEKNTSGCSKRVGSTEEENCLKDDTHG